MKLIISSENGWKDDAKEKIDWNWSKSFPHSELLRLLLSDLKIASEYETIDRIGETRKEIEESVQEILNLIGEETCWENEKIFRAIKILRKLEC